MRFKSHSAAGGCGSDSRSGLRVGVVASVALGCGWVWLRLLLWVAGDVHYDEVNTKRPALIPIVLFGCCGSGTVSIQTLLSSV